MKRRRKGKKRNHLANHAVPGPPVVLAVLPLWVVVDVESEAKHSGELLQHVHQEAFISETKEKEVNCC